MSPIDDDADLTPYLRTLRIMIGTLTAGPTILLVICFFLHSKQAVTPRAKAAAQPFLTYIAVGFAAVLLPTSILLPRIIGAASVSQIARQKGKGSPEDKPEEWTKLAVLYQTRLIMGAAVNEGAAFFAAIAYLLEGQYLAAALALVLILGVLARYPSRDGIERWIHAQQSRIQELRAADA